MPIKNVAIDKTDELLFNILLLLEVVGYVIHFILGCYFVWRIKNITLIHANLRIVLCVKVTQYFFMAFGRIGDLLNAASTTESLVLKNSLCLVFKFNHDAGLFITAFCPLWVAAERICATLMIKTYADRTANVGIWLAGSTHFCGFTVAALGIYYDLHFEIFDVYESRESCQLTHLHPTLVPVVWCLIGLIFVVSAIILIYLYQHNIKMKAIKLSTNLTARYQYSENVRTLRFLVPAFVGLGSLNLMAALAVPYIYLKFAQGQDVQLMYQALYLIPVGYGIYFITYVFLKYEQLRKAMKNDFSVICPCCCPKVNKIRPKLIVQHDVQGTTDIYWKQFDNAWANGPLAKSPAEKKKLDHSNSKLKININNNKVMKK
ncbi:unnamed protein product [Bursaphelenchus okinawaensis]|uniref:G_PROTEIN_RECEP_F1_2 domain-containing protein n=1 Tax=Bursaphelenchus okinawaensis TaxID=465554 RepID=A0A811LTU9_9BILA|nr:unnamed protein product [Bursaphelenchus okinawaensis]CAG9127945.1 unnamed protein product [Bursaphelenchus okinawaensis]